jgi:AraC-like DNA-binding protein
MANTLARMSNRLEFGAMDALTALLEGPRADQAHLLRAVMARPWAIAIEDEAPLALVAVTHGDVWLRRGDRPPVPLAEGTVALLRGPEHYVVADAPDADPTIVVGPGNDCRSLDGRSVAESLRLGVRSWGTGSLTPPSDAGRHPDEHEMLIGTYESVGALGRRTLEVLPSTIVTTAAELGSPLVELLGQEMNRPDPGQSAVLDRLLDLLVVSVLRTWLAACGDTCEAGWFRGHTDDVVGPALRLLHDHPERAWTVAGLAAEVGVSRAALARRFHQTVGEPPLAYLTGWRMALASDLLAEPDATVTAVARAVGYSTPFAFSAAFKRVRGLSPAEHRSQARSARSA